MPTAPIFLIAPSATDQAAAESVRDFLDRLRATSAQPAVDALTPAEIVAVRGMLGEYDELCRNAATILEHMEADLDEAVADVTNTHTSTMRDDLDALAERVAKGGETGTVGAPTPAPTAADLVAYINEHHTALALGWRTLLGYGMSSTASVIADLLALAEEVAR